MKEKYCSIYVRNAEEGPACYYRIVQYTKDVDAEFQINSLMTRRMFRLNLNWKHKPTKLLLQAILYVLMAIRGCFFLTKDYIKSPRYIVIQRTTIPRHISKPIQFLLRKALNKSIVYWDFDDDIFVSGEICSKQADILSAYSNKIIVTSNHLKSKLNREFINKVIILPTTDGDFSDFDLELVSHKRKISYEKNLKLIWVGTSNNLIYVKEIINYLDDAAKIILEKQNKKVLLTIVSNKPLENTTKFLKIENKKWSREVAIEEIIKSHIGLMPLSYSEYALGKGGFKLIQYICAGVPVIASNIGFNSNIVNNENGFLVDSENQDEWVNAIITMSSNWENLKRYSEKSRDSWELNFSYDNNLKVWRDLFIQ